MASAAKGLRKEILHFQELADITNRQKFSGRKAFWDYIGV